MTFVNFQTRPAPSHVFLDGKKVDRWALVAADDVAGYVETVIFDERRGRPHVKMINGRPATRKIYGTVRIVFAVILDNRTAT